MDTRSADDLHQSSGSVESQACSRATLLQVSDDQIRVALTAYKGGPGNTRPWLDAVSGDQELFAEAITAEECQQFLPRVYEGYVIYGTLYQAAGS